MSGLRQGARCTEVERTADAVAACTRQAFDACFLSLGLADGENGLLALDQLLARWPDLRVVIHTSRAEADLQVREAMSRGAFAYLAKPLRRDGLEAVLREIDRSHPGSRRVR